MLRLRSFLPLLALAACATPPPSARPRAARPPVRAPAPAVRQPVPLAKAEIYPVDEALRDALSGSWEYLGTGMWPGNSRVDACAFRNERVLVVNTYCTLSEVQAFRVEVYSPERGRVRIYAEANGAVSRLGRGDYFTFTAESEPPPQPQLQLPRVDLGMSFDELRAYEALRYEAFLPTCFGGEQLSQAKLGCLGELAPRKAQWAQRNQAFLQHPTADWYRLVREMRSLAKLHGTEPQ